MAENEKTDDELANELAAELSDVAAPPGEVSTPEKKPRKPRATPAPEGGFRDVKAKAEKAAKPKHDLAKQVKTLGADSLLPVTKAKRKAKPVKAEVEAKKATATKRLTNALKVHGATDKEVKKVLAKKQKTKTPRSAMPLKGVKVKTKPPAKAAPAKTSARRGRLSKLQPIGKITNARSRIRGGVIGGGMKRVSGMVQVTMLLHAKDVARIRAYAKTRNLSLSEAGRQFVAGSALK